MGTRGGTLTVRVESLTAVEPFSAGTTELASGNYARLTVADTGSGMDAATVERIFDPFFTTKEVGQGTGLGLSVVHGIVRTHEGGIAVKSSPGQGTEFEIYFPASRARAAGAPRAVRDDMRGRGERILYVDDEESTVRATARVLERLGYQVVAEVDPRRALEIFERAPMRFDAVIMNFHMPKITALDLSRKLLGIRPRLPVIVTSGRIEPEDARALQELGIVEIILKPSSVDDLGGALHRLLGRSHRWKV
jgi:CheY-like chemotaxis protein